MARKILNRKVLREEVEAAEAAGKDKKTGEAEAAKKPKRKSRAKEPVVVRLKLFWGVFNASMKRVALYEFTQKKQAEQKAADLNQGGKQNHIVLKVKEQVTQE
ncbi:MAG: hypothetical protein FJ295_18245 [Planctomycetes bacterium]|nr:hypothetical protein [Planctomycetota bacterium]